MTVEKYEERIPDVWCRGCLFLFLFFVLSRFCERRTEISLENYREEEELVYGSFLRCEKYRRKS